MTFAFTAQSPLESVSDFFFFPPRPAQECCQFAQASGLEIPHSLAWCSWSGLSQLKGKVNLPTFFLHFLGTMADVLLLVTPSFFLKKLHRYRPPGYRCYDWYCRPQRVVVPEPWRSCRVSWILQIQFILMFVNCSRFVDNYNVYPQTAWLDYHLSNTTSNTGGIWFWNLRLLKIVLLILISSRFSECSSTNPTPSPEIFVVHIIGCSDRYEGAPWCGLTWN